MNITAPQLESELEAFGHHRIEIVAELAHDGPPDGIGPALMLAMGSRETDLRNIVGDHGHGRGWLQIDDRFHPGFLSSHRGCDSGSFTAKFASALQLLRDNMQFAREHGVPKAQVLRFAVAAYNAGAGGALAGFKAGNVDRNTAAPSHDYSADVLARAQVVARFLKRHALST
jgi:hypothetical protein